MPKSKPTNNSQPAKTTTAVQVRNKIHQALEKPTASNTERQLLIIEALKGAILEDLADVYQNLTSLAKDGQSWRAAEAWLKTLAVPELRTAEHQHAQSSLAEAVESGKLTDLLTNLAEDIATKGGLALPDLGAGEDATFEDRLDAVRISLYRRTIQGNPVVHPTPIEEAPDPVAPRDEGTPPTPSQAP